MDYRKWMKKEERRKCTKVLIYSALIFCLCAFIVYSNTRFNGFADVRPFSHYTSLATAIIDKICDILFNFSQRFLH